MSLCTHCDEEIVRPSFNREDVERLSPFCCDGCLTVFNVIHQKGFEAYYEIKKNSKLIKPRSPVGARDLKFKYMDDSEFCSEYTYPHFESGKTMQFYLEGIHCLGCLWLIEKMPEFLPSVLSSKLDMERSVVTVVIRIEAKFSEVAEELNKLGYRPHPLKINQESETLKIKEHRQSLYRIGIAGASAGNIMIYAVSLYAGAEKDFSQLFNSLTVLFAIPVLTYSAFPFYQNAWHALRNRTVSIDIPISMALIIGGIMGMFNLFQGIPENYFDSLTTLVFLLLLSRFFLQKIQEMSLSSQDLHFFYLNENILKVIDLDKDLYEEIHPSLLKKEDLIKIKSQEFIPADGIVEAGFSHINNSLLTGESLPVSVSPGQRVFSGTQNLSGDIVVRVEEIQKQTRLGKILKSVEDGWFQRSKIVTLTNHVSKYFTLVVCLLSLGLFFTVWETHNLNLAFERAITLLIVTCPCALALAVPLTFTRALSEASRHGIIIKSDEVIESIAQVEHLFLDKTGTITHGKLELIDFKILKSSILPVHDIIHNLEAKSNHPVAIALKEFIRNQSCQTQKVSSFKETFGVGVTGLIDNHSYSITKEGVFENSELVATFKIKDKIRDDSKTILSRMMKSVKSVQILSGDNIDIVKGIAHAIQLPESMAHGNLKPEDKSFLVRNTQKTMMVGDGANDAIALSHASVGVAVFGAVDISLRAADVFLSTPGLGPVEKLLTLSQETMKVVRRNLVLSLLYNSLSVIAVFMGIINPLVAAIIMPLSSLTVLVSTLVGTKKSRVLWKS